MKFKQFVITKDGPRFLGETGRHPYGQADETDEGEIQMALAADHGAGIVRVMFGKPVAWLGLPSTQARDLAAMLIEKADELDKQRS